ncbi:glycosyltransferase family 2 protein [Streptomyces violaceoruber]
MLISIVAPCYNEEDVIERFHAAVQKVADDLLPLGHDMEFVYVDDGSRDRTLTLLEQLAEHDPRVRYVSFSRNFGKEAALLAGLRHASGDSVVVMDADLQHPPELIGRMVELRDEGYDQVLARRSRAATGSPGPSPPACTTGWSTGSSTSNSSTAWATSGCCRGAWWTRCWA